MMRLSATDYGIHIVTKEFYRAFVMSALVNLHSISMKFGLLLHFFMT